MQIPVLCKITLLITFFGNGLCQDCNAYVDDILTLAVQKVAGIDPFTLPDFQDSVSYSVDLWITTLHLTAGVSFTNGVATGLKSLIRVGNCSLIYNSQFQVNLTLGTGKVAASYSASGNFEHIASLDCTVHATADRVQITFVVDFNLVNNTNTIQNFAVTFVNLQFTISGLGSLLDSFADDILGDVHDPLQNAIQSALDSNLKPVLQNVLNTC